MLSCGGCAGNHICPSGNPLACGADLPAPLASLDDGDTLHDCPGRHQAGFTLTSRS
jgi:hypothetical protein